MEKRGSSLCSGRKPLPGMCTLENIPNELGDLTKEISRQILKVPLGFLLKM